MVRFAPPPAPFLVLRETISPAHEYGLALASVANRHSHHSEAVEARLASAPGTGADGLSSTPTADPTATPAPGPVPDLLSYPAPDPAADPVANSAPTRTADPDVPATSAPDPFTDADALEELEAEITTLAAHIHAATHRLLTLIAEFDRRRGWELGGHRTCAHWLSFRTGIDLGAAREKVRAARALEELPETSASMARGELSFSKVRALTRVATPGNEGDLVALARGCTAAQLERMVRAFGRGSREEETEAERRRHASRTFSVFPDDDEMYLVRGRLPAEIGALLMRAVEAASDAIFREEWAGIGSGAGEREVSAVGGSREAVSAETPRSGVESEKRAAQRRADALGLLAERALAAGFGNGPVSGTGAARYQVVLHVDAETLAFEETAKAGEGPLGPAEVPGRSHLEDGTRVSAETSRRISCDAGVVRVTHGPRDVDRGEWGRGPRKAGPAGVDLEERRHWPSDRRPVGPGTNALQGLGSPPTAPGAVSSARPGPKPADPTPMGFAPVRPVPAGPTPMGSAPVGSLPIGAAHDGPVLDVGRRTRTIPPALRRALEIRDKGCRFPGCGSRFTDAHHVKHWADGGQTSLENTLLLCRHHHRLVHEGGWTVDWWGQGRPVFFDPRGGTRFEGRWEPPAPEQESLGFSDEPRQPRVRGRGVAEEGPRTEGVSAETPPPEPHPRGADPRDLAESLLEENRRRGVVPDSWTPSARWKREADIPDRVYFRAVEAVESGGDG